MIVIKCKVWLVELLVVIKFIRVLRMFFLLMSLVKGRIFLFVNFLAFSFIKIFCKGLLGLIKLELVICNFINFIIIWLELVVL